MLADAEARGLLCPGALLVEPTGGNTGLSLAALAIPRGYRLHLTVPSGVSEDKLELLRSMGAVVTECDSSLGISDPLHFVNVARSIAQARLPLKPPSSLACSALPAALVAGVD